MRDKTQKSTEISEVKHNIITYAADDLIARRTAKDSVFCDLFKDKKYLLQLYQALHPEDIDTTEDDLTDITIRNVLADGLYNDIGFRNKNKVIILTEAQSTWSMNILIRMMLYLAETYHHYFRQKDADLYSRTKVLMPEAELYVVFIGKRTNQPEYISLSEEFFQGKQCSVEIKAKVLYGEGSKDIISQYVKFSKVYTEQVKKYGYTRKAVLETIRICMDQEVLTEYLRTRESEVVSIMMELFDEEYIQRAYRKRIINETTEEVTREVTKEVTREVTREVTEKAMATTMATAAKMLKSGRIKMDEISEFFPQITEENIRNLQQML